MNPPTSISSAASEDLLLLQSGTDFGRSPSATANHTPKPSSESTGRKFPATRTSGKYEATYTQESLFSPADFHANHSVLPGSSEARTTTAISGRKCAESYARQGQLGSLVRMLLESSTWHSTRCVLTWKRKVTKSNRSLFQLAPSMPRTEGTGSGFWRTPETSVGGTVSQMVLEEMGNGKMKRKSGQQRQLWLQDQVRNPKLWPTPRAAKPEGYSSSRFRPTLAQVVTNKIKPLAGRLNPAFVEYLMGYPTGHTALNHSEMPSSRRSRRKSSGALHLSTE